MAVSHLFTEIEEQLHGIYKDPLLCKQSAWWILQAITKQSKTYLLTTKTVELTAYQQEQLATWMHKLVHEHMPLQYLLGSVPFNGCEILVEPPILIPRPETEELTLNLIEQLKQLPNQQLTVLDMCSGSGCIGLAIAKELPAATVYGVDISEQAIALGKKNAHHNNITNISFIQSDLFTALPATLKCDLIISNPPYIAEKFWPDLDVSVKEWEDRRALIAEDGGLEIIKKIILKAPHHLQPNNPLANHAIPQLSLEIDYNQGAIVATLMKHAGYMDVTVHKDLEGNDRVVSGRISDVATAKNR